jgi:hypothetical protein
MEPGGALVAFPARPVQLKEAARPFADAFREHRLPAFDPSDLWSWIGAADWLIEQGELAAAELAVRRLHEVEPELEWAANLCGLFDRLPPIEPDMADFRDDMTRDVQVARRPGSRLAVLVFCGVRHRVGMPLPLMHRWLSRLGASIVYLRDFRGLCYLGGVQSLGDFERTKAALRELLSSLGVTRAVSYGCSGGGFAALRYALDLGADGVCLGSPVNLTPAFNAHMNHGSFADELQAAFPDEELDLRKAFEARPGATRALVAFGGRNWNERIQAEHMRGIEGVILHPIKGYGGHSTASELIRRGDFEPLIGAFVHAAPHA